MADLILELICNLKTVDGTIEPIGTRYTGVLSDFPLEIQKEYLSENWKVLKVISRPKSGDVPLSMITREKNPIETSSPIPITSNGLQKNKQVDGKAPENLTTTDKLPITPDEKEDSGEVDSAVEKVKEVSEDAKTDSSVEMANKEQSKVPKKTQLKGPVTKKKTALIKKK